MGRRGGGRRPPQQQFRPKAPGAAPVQKPAVPAPQKAVAQPPAPVAQPNAAVAEPKKSWADMVKAKPAAPAKVKAPEPAPVTAPDPAPAPVLNPREERKLKNIFRDLDKGKRKPEAQRFGSGSTADAVRHELANPGTRVGGRSHSQKAQEYCAALDNWVARNPDAPAELIREAKARSKDLKDALNGK